MLLWPKQIVWAFIMKYINKHSVAVAVIVSIIISIIFFIFQSKDTDKKYSIPGYIEANLSYIAADGVSGQLLTLDVQKGQAITQGQHLFTLDSAQYQFKNQADQHNVSAKLANYEDLLTGKRPAYIKQVEADIAQQQENLGYLQKRYNRAKLLLENNSTSQQEYDLANSQYEQAQAHLASLQYQKNIYTLKAREQQIISAKSNAALAKSQQALSYWRVQQTAVKSPSDAIIFDTYYWPGEQVQAGRAVVSLLLSDRIRLIFYLPLDELHSIKLGDSINFTIDGDPRHYPAKISYISPQAEYTPPVIYSQSTRQDLSFKLEAQIDRNFEKSWHPGQPVNVVLTGSIDA